MPVQTSVCDPWPIRPCCDLPDDPDTVDYWTRVASNILWRLSGRRWGPCPVTVRPCRRACLESSVVSFQAGVGTGPYVPYIGVDGQWRNAAVCGCAPSGCSCSELCEVKLEGPVYDVVEVNVDGQVLVPGVEYRVDSPGLLVRLGGECWPTCQDMSLPEGDPGTFTVTYRWGLALDESAEAAVSELFCHLLKGCGGGTGSCGCKANPRITRIQRQGVEMEMPDPTLMYSEGLTGLPLVDLWLTTVNPDGLSRPSRVYSVDYRRPRRTTWP